MPRSAPPRAAKPNRPPRPKVKAAPQVRISFGATFPLGPGKVKLIEAVARTGSISAAAREAGMSYRRAWVLIDEVNRLFRAPLIATATGGKGGGGATVTDFGALAVRRYREIEAKVTAGIARELQALGEMLAPTPPPPPRSAK